MKELQYPMEGQSWLTRIDWPLYVSRLSFGSIGGVAPKGQKQPVNKLPTFS